MPPLHSQGVQAADLTFWSGVCEEILPLQVVEKLLYAGILLSKVPGHMCSVTSSPASRTWMTWSLD